MPRTFLAFVGFSAASPDVIGKIFRLDFQMLSHKNWLINVAVAVLEKDSSIVLPPTQN